MVIVLVLLTVAAFLALDYYVRRGQVEEAPSLARAGAPGRATSDPDIVQVPCGTYMAPGHTWLRPEPDGSLRMGAGRVPLHALGAVDDVQLMVRGSSIHRGEAIAVLVRGHRRLHLVSPVDGVIDAVNPELATAPACLQENPFEAGWLYTIRPRELAEALRRTFVAEEAESFIRRELGRLRDALSAPVGGAERAEALLDGGVPLAGFAERLAETQWSSVCRTMFENPPFESEADPRR